jgi:hypothetical protein
MNTATHDDIVRLFPGLQDHTVVEILATNPSVSDLEAASLLLGDQDNGLIEVKQQAGDRLSRLLAVLAKAEIRPRENDDH